MAKHHHYQREASKLRKLRKQDKRAAAILIAAHRYKPKSFADGFDGRWSYWNCDYWGSGTNAQHILSGWIFDSMNTPMLWLGGGYSQKTARRLYAKTVHAVCGCMSGESGTPCAPLQASAGAVAAWCLLTRQARWCARRNPIYDTTSTSRGAETGRKSRAQKYCDGVV